MATQCGRCGRGALKANLKSHSNVKTIRHQKINIQSKKVDGQRMQICTNCIREISKIAAK